MLELVHGLASPLAWLLALLTGAIALFVAKQPRNDVVALMAMLAVLLSGILSPEEALAGFADPNVLLIAALLVVGEGLVPWLYAL